jgi:hypothetical protein
MTNQTRAVKNVYEAAVDCAEEQAEFGQREVTNFQPHVLNPEQFIMGEPCFPFSLGLEKILLPVETLVQHVFPEFHDYVDPLLPPSVSGSKKNLSDSVLGNVVE